MRNRLLDTLTIIGAALLCSALFAWSQVPNFPQTLAANTVVGRLATAGPSQAIPFATLAAQLGGTVLAPATSTLNGLVCWNSTVGSLLKDCGTVAGAWTFSGKISLTSTDSVAVAKGTSAQRNGSPTAGDTRYNSTLNGLEYYNGTAWIITGQAPTVQTFTSGSAATYTPATGVVRIRVRMVGGGGGGGGRTAGTGSNGTTSSFGSWTAIFGSGGGFGGAAAGAGGSGGASGTGTQIVRIPGGTGTAGSTTATSGTILVSGAGGSTPFGFGPGAQQTIPVAPPTNSGGGGGGGGGATGTASGSGGGGGEYVEFWVNSPSATTYTVGGGGAGGTSGANGVAGAAGIIIIEESYQ